MAQEVNEYREQRLQSMKALKEMGFEPYGCKYDHEDLAKVRETFEEGKSVRVVSMPCVERFNFAWKPKNWSRCGRKESSRGFTIHCSGNGPGFLKYRRNTGRASP